MSVCVCVCVHAYVGVRACVCVPKCDVTFTTVCGGRARGWLLVGGGIGAGFPYFLNRHNHNNDHMTVT